MSSNPDMFTELYDQYADAIFRHCFFRMYSRERAMELMQETFLKFWQYTREGNEVHNPKALLYRIATHLVIDEKRKHKEESLDAMLQAAPQLEPMGESGDDIERQVLLHDVFNTLDELPEKDRELIIMRYIDDLDPKDIAEALGTTPNTISVRLNKIVKKIQAII